MTKKVSIVTPSYEKHISQYEMMIASLVKHCTDIIDVEFIVVVEEKNVISFRNIFNKYNIKNHKIITTESILSHFECPEEVDDFIRRVGKFTFQTVKKFGGLLQVENDWAIVLDSEGIFCRDFAIADLVRNYEEQKYVFYTDVVAREGLWEKSLGYQINKNISEILQFDCNKRWYMEYFHWFYESSKVKDLINNHLQGIFLDYIRNESQNYDFNFFKYEGKYVDFFENIIYYNYLEKYYSEEYKFLNFKDVLDTYLPASISGRFILNELPFSLFGNDYLLNIVSPEEIKFLSNLFSAFKLPFIRLEPPFFTPRYFEELGRLPNFVATISSHHHIWMNRKIAVCISGEFRHIVHRTPEQQVRALKGFLSGVDCDVYIHGWHNTSEPLIVDEIKPKKYKFEERKSFLKLERQIRHREPRLKPGRDLGSLSMFYSLQQAYDLIDQNNDKYDYVVRIRPDIFPDLSLKEILVQISDGGDYIENSVYVPKIYHSKGINDQFAIGTTQSMSVYMRTYDYLERNITSIFFNPESILLKNLLEHSIKPCVVEFPYALMRHLPFRAHEISRVMHEQEHTWWSRTDHLPALVDLTSYFSDKLRSMEDSMSGKVPNILFFPLKHVSAPYGDVFIEVKNDDNNPSKSIAAYFRSDSVLHTAHCVVNEKFVEFVKDFRKHTFVFTCGDNFVFSQWRFADGKFVNARHIIPRKLVPTHFIFAHEEMIAAWREYDFIQEREARGEVVWRKIDEEIPPHPIHNAEASSQVMETGHLHGVLRLFSLILSQKMKNKLARDPALFFRDSNSIIAKKIGKLYNYN